MTRFRSLGATLVLATALAACSDGSGPGPASPAGPIATLVVRHAGDGQTAPPGEAVAVPPTVRVRGSSGAPLAGVEVRFSVIEGGGTLAAGEALTDAQGYASAERWTLGTAGANRVQARAGSVEPVVFTATAEAPRVEPPPPPPPPPAAAFTIDVQWVGTATARQRASVQTAVQRWQSVIVSDLQSIPMQVSAGTCFPEQPAINRVVDDLLLFVQFVEIDGPQKVLGEAGPCFIRNDGGLPVVGYIKLDVADLELMESAGTLDDVVLHELGHVLGIGTLWARHALVSGAGTDDPGFLGAHALGAWSELGGSGSWVPIENTGGSGTREGHWRESVFGNELMTGYIRGVPNPLSALTISSLRDLGYGASVAGAGSYTLGVTTGRTLAEPLDLRARERVHGPKFRVDRTGRHEKIPN